MESNYRSGPCMRMPMGNTLHVIMSYVNIIPVIKSLGIIIKNI